MNPLNLLKFGAGWIVWHVKAAWWYLVLGFRLFFAVGLDQDYHPDQDQDMNKLFKYQEEKTYLRYLKR